MTKNEALKLCNYLECNDASMEAQCKAAAFIRDALAQPEQEPVAWMNDSTPSGIFARHIEGAKNFGCTVPLYTTLPQRKPLTDEEIADFLGYRYHEMTESELEFFRLGEAAHGIKE